MSDPNPQYHSNSSKKKMTLPVAIIITLIMVIFVRESAVLVCQTLGYPSAANIVGMITMFMILMIWRFTVGLPEWIIPAVNALLVDSGFAFLPVSAGAGLLIFGLGDELWGILTTMIISTLLSLWGLAKLANYWLSNVNEIEEATHHNKSTEASSSISSSHNSH